MTISRSAKFAVIFALVLALGMTFGSHIFAQEEAAEPAAPETREFTDEEIDAFLKVDTAVRQIQLEAARLTQATLDASGITIEDYTAVIRKLRQDPAFLERLKARAEILFPPTREGEEASK